MALRFFYLAAVGERLAICPLPPWLCVGEITGVTDRGIFKEVQVGPAERLPQLGQVYAAVVRASPASVFLGCQRPSSAVIDR
jgi:hypothetical protein